jgi:hypothetical protein
MEPPSRRSTGWRATRASYTRTRIALENVNDRGGLPACAREGRGTPGHPDGRLASARKGSRSGIAEGYRRRTREVLLDPPCHAALSRPYMQREFPSVS